MAENLKRCRAVQKLHKIFFENLKVFVDSKLQTAKASEIKIRLDDLVKTRNEFLKNQSTLELADEEELTSSIRGEIDEIYYYVRSSLEDRHEELILKTRKRTIQETVDGLAFTPQLPELTLEEFNGDFKKWKSFLNTFTSHVHLNPKLTTLTKFQYLKNSISGSAAKILENLDFIEENYDIAINLLIDRYDKPSFIAEEHIRALFKVKHIDNPTPEKLLNLLDEYNSHLRSLTTLGRPTNYWDDLIVYLIASKFDAETAAKWRESTPMNALPTLVDISNFIKNRSFKLQSKKQISQSSSMAQNNTIKLKTTRTSSLHAAKVFSCIYCNQSGHTIMRCHKFLSLSINDRRNQVQHMKLCFNCLRNSHMVDKCIVKESCKTCKKRHHTLLHIDSQPTTSGSPETISSPSTTSNENNPKTSTCLNNSISTSTNNRSSNYVFLSTALVNLIDKMGSPVTIRVLLDTGSQVNLITKSLVSKLGLNTSKTNSIIRGIGSKELISTNSTFININSKINNYSAHLEAQIVSKISGKQPNFEFSHEHWPIPSNIKLADPSFYIPSKIDLLIGNELVPEIQSIGQIKLGIGLPTLQNTLLGWIVCGSTNVNYPTEPFCHLSEIVPPSEDLNTLLKNFWSIEEVDNIDNTPLEDECETHFKENFSKDNSGRFIVRLPFLQSTSTLGNSEQLARRRFFNLENKLDKDPNLRNSYNEFMHSYISLDHMEPTNVIEQNHYYLPHHCVLKPDSTSTKLRVVFDGSAKTSSGLSLNQILMNGPVIQNGLFTTLTRFRSHAYAISADIMKMYRQVTLHPDDRKFHYIFWRFSNKDPLQTFKLKTVTYGTTSASFLATRCLIQLAQEFNDQYPLACSTIRNDIYVDDLLSGSNSLEELIILRRQISDILSSAGFILHKWCTNDLRSINEIPENKRESYLSIDDKQYVKTLGLFWSPTEDNFCINVNFSYDLNKSVTKRLITSEIARIFDPIGLISPIVVQGKLFIQRLWELKLNWDESLPQEISTKYLRFRDQIKMLSSLKIPRHIFNHCNSPKEIEIHAFADASERAYGVAVYVRFLAFDQRIMNLFCSKSRVAPLKRITIPRLELCAALLQIKLLQKITPTLNFKVTNFYYWTDSMIVLHWLNTNPSSLNSFVANRVTQIQSFSNVNDWRHIKSKENPADLVSRGLQPNEILTSELWWHGPSLLHSNNDEWKKPFISNFIEELPERKSSKSVLISEIHESIFDRVERTRNHFNKIRNVFSYVARFIRSIRVKRTEVQRKDLLESSKNLNLQELINLVPTLTIDETVTGLNYLIIAIQIESFPEVYSGLSKSPQYIVKDKYLKSLAVFMDENKLIRVGGRLKYSALTYSSKHPILLPALHCITLTIFRYFHRSHMHVGPQGLLAAVRQRYWAINGRRIAKKIYRECVLCSRARPILLQQKMSDLPVERVQASMPFLYTAVDYCGPFTVHYSIRGKIPTKAFLAVFVCLATKAVHLEISSNLSSSSFMGALERFVSTRGVPAKIFSDNGTNFVGSNNDLHKLYQLLQDSSLNESIKQFCMKGQIKWSFIPPGSPHFGGLHEAAVKSAKFHLKRILHNLHLTYEELSTIVKQVEAILNSRPLSTSDDLDMLTPGHFLIHRPLTAIPDPFIFNSNVNINKRWEITKNASHQFWNKWSTDYLKELQYRHKWQNQHSNICEGAIVILKDECIPPLHWKLGRVVATHPGPDNIVRVVTVKTSNSTLKRAVQKIAVLPVDVEPTVVQGGEDV